MGDNKGKYPFFDNQIGDADSSDNDIWLTTKEAACFLRISEASLRNMTSNGHVQYFKLGRRNRYRLSDLKNLLLSKRKGGNNHGN